MIQLFEWLENTSLAILIRQSLWLYPALEVIHIIGIVLLVGAAFMFDFRLLGYSKNLPVTGLSQHLLPWSKKGLLLIVPSGIMLFMTNAVVLGENFTFWLKMGLLVLAALNVLVFHRYIFKSDQNFSEILTQRAKLTAVFSIILWISIIACGRWLAY